MSESDALIVESGAPTGPGELAGLDGLGAFNGLKLDFFDLGIDGFEHPGLFVALALAIIAAQVLRYRARPEALPWPGLDEALQAGTVGSRRRPR